MKKPLYVPAVLRPTEFPTQAPATPPKSTLGSLESLQDIQSPAQQPDFNMYLAAFASHEPEHLGEVTGEPKRDHWRPDEASTSCDSPQCRANFNLFVRKHHCRHCGHIFCSTHANFKIPLDQAAKFHPDGYESRACETCHRQYQRWDTARSIKRKDSGDSQSDERSYKSTSAVPAHRRMISAAINAGGQKQQSHQQMAGSMANSVPKDWSWSTF